MGDREDHPGRGGHHGPGGRGGHEGPGRGGGHHGDGSHREELRDDMTQIHHDRDALRNADNPEERKKAREELRDSEQELKKDWGPGMPKHAGEPRGERREGERRDGDDHEGRRGHGGGGERRDDDGDHEGRRGHERRDND